MLATPDPPPARSTEITLALVSGLEVQWPTKMLEFLGWVRWLSFDPFLLPYIGCTIHRSFDSSLLLLTIGPVVTLIGMAGCVLAQEMGSHFAWKLGLLLVFSIYPRVCELTARAFACHELADGSRRLKADFSVVCDDSRDSTVVWAGAWP